MRAVHELLTAIESAPNEVSAHLVSVYPSPPLNRLYRLLQFFAAEYPHRDTVSVLRAPGRVNLIGEHTDYNGLPVMPMALDKDILVAFTPRNDNTVTITNPDFQKRSFSIEEEIPAYETGDWGNYIKAGVQRIVRLMLENSNEKSLETLRRQGDPVRGFDASFLGSIPIGAGLSSSSAMVVASAMVFMECNGLTIDSIALAEQMAEAEWYVGTQGGGMDQAACLLSRKNRALKIDFFPLRVRPVTLPGDYSIVVADSLVTASKTKEARLLYNTRPAECRAATALLANHLHQTEKTNVTDIQRIGDICNRIGCTKTVKIIEETFTKDRYSKTEIAFILGLTVKEVDSLFFTTKANDTIPEPPEGFPLGARARHVVTEAIRVEKSEEALQNMDVETFSEQINGSWRSCRDDYEIGHPAIDDIITIARRAGSKASRLTGAGFGGCTIHLVGNDQVPTFIDTLKREYYERAILNYREAAERIQKTSLEEVLFSASPSAGATVLF